MSDLMSPLLIPPRLQAATLVSRWQASIVHLEQARTGSEVGEREGGGQDQERSSSRDSNSGCP